MKRMTHAPLSLGGLMALVLAANGQTFTSGSTGADGALEVTANQTLDLPADGIFHCTTLHVSAGATLRFNRNALNTPVYLLATGEVTVEGTIDVSGGAGSQNPPLGGAGGPGGFDGGAPAAGGQPPGAGRGPGAGKGGDNGYTTPGSGAAAYGTEPPNSRPNNGTTYGTALLVPLVGGSGGGGTTGAPGVPGGGGGGAILIASSTHITVAGTGKVLSFGGENASAPFATGSGGAIRLLAPVVDGAGLLDVTGGAGYHGGGAGRVRIDTLDRSGLALKVQPTESLSLGALMMAFPSPLPHLDIVDAAGTAIAEGTPGPVQVLLPFGSSPDQTITLQARDFSASVPVRVVLTPENGTPVSYDATIDNLAANPATVPVNVTFPVNTVVTVDAWTTSP